MPAPASLQRAKRSSGSSARVKSSGVKSSAINASMAASREAASQPGDTAVFRVKSPVVAILANISRFRVPGLRRMLVCAVAGAGALAASGCALSVPLSPLRASHDEAGDVTGSIRKPGAVLSRLLDDEDWRRARAALGTARRPAGQWLDCNVGTTRRAAPRAVSCRSPRSIRPTTRSVARFSPASRRRRAPRTSRVPPAAMPGPTGPSATCDLGSAHNSDRTPHASSRSAALDAVTRAPAMKASNADLAPAISAAMSSPCASPGREERQVTGPEGCAFAMPEIGGRRANARIATGARVAHEHPRTKPRALEDIKRAKPRRRDPARTRCRAGVAHSTQGQPDRRRWRESVGAGGQSGMSPSSALRGDRGFHGQQRRGLPHQEDRIRPAIVEVGARQQSIQHVVKIAGPRCAGACGWRKRPCQLLRPVNAAAASSAWAITAAS